MTDDPSRPPFGGDDSPAIDESGLPEHEIDASRTAGGGVMGSGGTAIDRGTGELSDEPVRTDAPDPAAQPFSPAAGREWAAEESDAPIDDGPLGPGGEGDR